RESVHEWSALDKLRLRLLLANSILPLGLSMLGLLLLTIKPTPLEIWRWCSAMEVMVFLMFVATTGKSFRRLNLREVQRERGSRFMLSFFGALGMAALLLQGDNVAYLCACRGKLLRCSARSGRFSRGLCTNLSPPRPSLPG